MFKPNSFFFFLLKFKMEGSKYVFEAKTIQKMEILILSTLEWKMNPVTPLSFLDYITRRLGLKSYLSSEFLKRCECLLLCFLPGNHFITFLATFGINHIQKLVLMITNQDMNLYVYINADGRFRSYLPSVIATATMVHVIHSVEPCIGNEYESQLLGILGINKVNLFNFSR